MKRRVTKRRVTAEERAAYLDTEVCRRYGYVPVGWRVDEDGESLVLQVPAKREAPK